MLGWSFPGNASAERGSALRTCLLKTRIKKQQAMPAVFGIGALGEIRTPDHLVRSQVLYPTELRALNIAVVV